MSEQFWDDFHKKHSFTPEQVQSAIANYKPQSQNDDDGILFGRDSYIDNLIGAGATGALDVLGGITSFVGTDDTADYLLNKSQSLRNILAPQVDADFSLNYVLSPGGLTRSIGNAFGSTLALAPAMALAPESAVAGGTALLGKAFLNKALSNLITKGAVGRGVAKSIAEATPSAVRYGITSSPLESIAEGGFVRRENLENGMSEDDARISAWTTALLNAPLLMATNTLEGLALGAPIFRGAKGSKFNTAGQIAGRTGLESTQNAFEEAMQEIIANTQTGKNWDENVGTAALEGLFGGLGLGAGGGIFNAVRPQSQAVEDYQRGNESNAPLTYEDAMSQVLNERRNNEAVEDYQNRYENARQQIFSDAMQEQSQADASAMIQNLMNENSGQIETSTTPFDLVTDDGASAKIFDDFVAQKIKNPEEKTALANMLNDNGKFINTAENRNKIMKDYGDEIYQFAAEKNLAEQNNSKAENKIPESKIETKTENLKSAKTKLKNQNLVSQVRKIQEQAIQNKNAELSLKIDSAITANDVSAMQKILDDAGVTLTENAPQVEQNIETAPKENSQQKKLNRVKEIANKPVSKDSAVRKLQGRALIEILRQNNLLKSINKTVQESLENGYAGRLRQVQAALRKLNYLPQTENLQNLENKNAEVVQKTAAPLQNKILAENSIQEQKAQEKLNEKEKRYLENAKNLAGDTISSIQSSRQRQGKAINYVVKKNNITFPEGLSQALNEGYEQAIKLGQETLRNAGISIGYGEENLTSTSPKKSAPVIQNQTPIQNPVENNNVNEEIQNAKRQGRQLEILANGRRLDLPDGLVQSAKDGNAEALKILANYLNNPNTNIKTNPKIEAQEVSSPTSKKTYHFDGTKTPQSSEEFINNSAEETKKALVDLAEKSWNDKNYNGKVSFEPSKKSATKFKNYLVTMSTKFSLQAATFATFKNITAKMKNSAGK